MRKFYDLDIKKFTLMTELFILFIIIICRLAIASVERKEQVSHDIFGEPGTSVLEELNMEPSTEDILEDIEAEYLARVLYGVKDYDLSSSAKKAIIDVIFNRTDVSYGQFGDSIIEVCSMPNQFQGFVEDGYFLEKDFNLARERLSGNYMMRSIPNDCYWFKVEYGRIIVRNNYDESKATTIITIS